MAVDLTDCVDGLYSILTSMTYSGASIGTVRKYKPPVHSEAAIRALLVTGNPTQTAWVISEGATDGVWVDTPASSIQRNFELSVEGYRPFVDTDVAVASWRDIVDAVHKELAKESHVRLDIGVLAKGIHCGPWSITERGCSDLIGLYCNYARFEATVQNAPEVP